MSDFSDDYILFSKQFTPVVYATHLIAGNTDFPKIRIDNIVGIRPVFHEGIMGVFRVVKPHRDILRIYTVLVNTVSVRTDMVKPYRQFRYPRFRKLCKGIIPGKVPQAPGPSLLVCIGK